jgi:Domain of unknown function (DUF4157)
MRSQSQAVRKQETVSQFLTARRGGGQSLDSVTRAFMESRFGHDFSNVRVHTGRKAAQSAESIGASAYTAGVDIVFGAGAFNGRRLAHELTHVVQQSGHGGSSAAQVEAEAQMNANRVAAGLPGHVRAAAVPGTVQCDEADDEKKKKTGEKKLENEFSTGSTATIKSNEVKNKFAFSGEAAFPLFPGFKLGPIAGVNNLTFKSEGEKEAVFDPAKPQIPGPGDIKEVQTALKLSEALKAKIEAKGFSLGAGLEASTTLGYGTGKGVGLSAGAKATVEAAYKSPSLLPKVGGDLNLSVAFKGIVAAGVDLNNKQTANATGTLKAGADYKSPTLRGPAGTFLGILGDKANLSLGAEGSVTGTAETDNDPATKQKDPNLKLGIGGFAALTGAGPQQPFVKLKVSGEGILSGGRIDPASRATVADLSVGFNF